MTDEEALFQAVCEDGPPLWRHEKEWLAACFGEVAA
jgi:hypothetical protein